MSPSPHATARAAPPRVTRSAAATEALGEALAPALATGDVLALSGPLGAGKTRLVAGLARGLAAAARVRSPTFTLVNEYHGRVTLYHLDFYRLEAPEAADLGLEEYAERGALAVEWGERLPAVWRREALRVTIEPRPGETRVLRAEATAGRGLALLEAWAALPGGEAP